MEKERKIDHWTVAQAIYLGDREIALGIDENCDIPYLVTDVLRNNLFDMEEYDNTVGSDDYLEAMEEFSKRVQLQVGQMRSQRKEREAQGVDMAPLGSDACLPDSREMDFSDRVVVIDAKCFRPEYATPDYQLCVATGGNGCRPDARGTSVFCFQLYNGDHIDCRRYQVLGVADEAKLPEWAKERISRLRDKGDIAPAHCVKGKRRGNDEIYK